jgi:hypothetical protein
MKKISRRARPHSITLYNYISTTAGAAAYQRTVIDRVYLDTGYQQRLAARGILTTDKAQLIIDLRDIDTTADRTFLPVEDWNLLSAAQKASYFTFAAANDFFVRGVATETLPATTKQQMMSNYRCFSVTAADVPASDSDGAVILEVTGK